MAVQKPLIKRAYQTLFDWLYAYVLAPIFAAFLHLLSATLRWDLRGREHLAPFWDEGRPVCVGCWHGRLIMIPYAWKKQGRGDAFVLMGKNRNGELITRIVSTFRMNAIRGGSRSGGEQARAQMAEAVRTSTASTLALTPDGPHGPRYVSKMGMAHLSRTLDVPVVWVTATARWSIRFPSFDRFMLPLPFSRVVVSWSPPIYPGDHSDLGLEGYRDELDRIGRHLLRTQDEELGVLTEDDRAVLDRLAQGKVYGV